MSDEPYSVHADPHSNVDAVAEDKAAEKSEKTGTIPKSEVEDLGGSANIIDQRTRGVKNDAMKADRDIDEAVADSDAQDQGM